MIGQLNSAERRGRVAAGKVLRVDIRGFASSVSLVGIK